MNKPLMNFRQSMRSQSSCGFFALLILCVQQSSPFKILRCLDLTNPFTTGLAVAWLIAIPTGVSAEPLPVKTQRVGVVGAAPFVVREDTKLSGISVEIWSKIARSKGIEYQLIPQSNVQATLDAIAKGDLDMAIGPISITAKRLEENIEFTQPYFLSEISVLTSSKEPTAWSRIKPFFGTAVLTSIGILIVLLFTVGNLIWLVERNHNSEHFPKDYLHGVGNGMWFALVTLTTVGYGDRTPITRLGRFIAGSWMVVTLVTVSSLTAGLASAFTVAFSGLSTERIRDASDLKNARVVVIKGSSSIAQAQKHQARIETVSSLADGVELVTTGSADAMTFDRPAMEYYINQHPNLDVKVASFALTTELYGFALPVNSPLMHDLNIELLRLSETGEVQDILDRWLYAKQE
ncbi:MAG: transporter substrate-binding domain-containing protein [Coleofasciculus chthonoplastes F1-TOW-03]|jgi:polar amino acid transport system substrate-binding protein